MAALWAAIFALVLSFVIVPGAQASGETYKWGDTGNTKLTASGGNFSADTTFTKGADNNGNATFTATNVTYQCAGQSKTGDLTITITSDQYQKTYPTPGTITNGDDCLFTPIGIDPAGNVDPVTGQPTDSKTDQCDQGSLTWLLCPVMDNLSGAISSLAKDALVPLLRVNRVSPDTTPGLYQTWTHVRDLADVLFILVFFAIIGATLLNQDIGLDAYTIKKIWPRLIIAAVLVQFSFLICALLVDVGNVLGAGVEALFNGVLDPSKGPASFTNLLGNMGAIIGGLGVAGGAALVLGSWAAALPILVSLLLSLLAVFLTLGARYLILAVLIALSPLAMLGIILPNTRDNSSDWFKLYFRLILMYPMIVAVLSLAGIVNQLLAFSPGGPGGGTTDSGPAAVAAALIKPLVVVAAFMIIPVTFRLAGRTLHAAHSFLNGAAQRGKGALRGSEFWQRGVDERQRRKNTYMGRVLNSGAITSLKGKGVAGKAAAGLMSGGAALALAGAPATTESLQRSNSSLVAKTKKQLSELKEAQNPINLQNALKAANGDVAAREKLRSKAPELLRYASTAPGREAMMGMLYDTEFAGKDDLNQFLNASPQRGLRRLGTSGNVGSEWRSLRDAGQFKRNQLMGIVQRLDQDESNYEIKDRAGNVLQSGPRKMGSIDVNGVAKSFSKATTGDLTSKISIDNYEIMMDNISSTATTYQKEAAVDTALGMAIGVTPQQLSSFFNTKDRNAGALEKKLVMAQAMRATNAEVWNKPEYAPTFNAVVDQIQKDTKMVDQLARSAGVSDSEINRLSDKGKAYVVTQWLQDRSFDFKTYNSSKASLTDINVEANAYFRDKEKLVQFEKKAQGDDRKWDNQWQSEYPTWKEGERDKTR